MQQFFTGKRFIVYLLIVFIGIIILFKCLWTTIFTELFSGHPKLSDYPFVVKQLSKKKHRIAHFPADVPAGHDKYFFYVDSNKDLQIHFLKFRIDISYINNYIVKNSPNVYQRISKDEIGKYYANLDVVFGLDNSWAYDFYILRNEPNDDNYTSGFVVSPEGEEIVFFYATKNLEKKQTLYSK